MPEVNNKLLSLVARRHPEYAKLLVHWDFLEQTYNGGREWFVTNIFQYIKEGAQEYADRVSRAYRFNHTREVVDLINKYVFKSPISRNEDAPKELQDFWKQATLSGLDIRQFMMLVGSKTSVFGRCWIFADSNKSQDIITIADQKNSKAQVYVYLVKPQDILDVSFDQYGQTNWVLVREHIRDDADPIEGTGVVGERFRLWTRSAWSLYETYLNDADETDVRLMANGEHNLGCVPGFPVDHMIGDFRWSSPGLINDIAYLDRATANYLSNLDAIIQDQTFSQLTIPAQALSQSTDKNTVDQIVEMGTKRIFTYDGEGGAKPEYISPDSSQARIILEVINKIIGEIYHTIGMAGERTKTDNAVGIENSSGVAKAYDFERVNSLLASKANALENAENWISWLVMKWHGKEDEKEYVSYPDTFDVRSLFDEFTIAEKLALVNAPLETRREQMKQVIDKLWPQINEQLRTKLEAELKDWLKIDEEALLSPPTGGSRAKPEASKRQGQVV
jgi:hypothetical protein